jgi:hypothetical protein
MMKQTLAVLDSLERDVPTSLDKRELNIQWGRGCIPLELVNDLISHASLSHAFSLSARTILTG